MTSPTAFGRQTLAFVRVEVYMLLESCVSFQIRLWEYSIRNTAKQRGFRQGGVIDDANVSNILIFDMFFFECYIPILTSLSF